MLDIQLIRKHRDVVATALRKRMSSTEVDDALNSILELDSRRRALVTRIETSQAERKKVGRSVGPALTDDTRAAERVRKEQLGQATLELREVDEALRLRLAELPNMPADDVPAGTKSNNKVVTTWGKPPNIETPDDHVSIASRLGMVDVKRGVKLSGSGFWSYTGIGAQLEWAIINYCIQQHIASGYEFVLPPHILLEQAGFAAGQFPKFYDDVYHIESNDSARGQFLLPTAETAILGLYQDEILEDLPTKVFSYTPCYRRERAGSHSDETGTVRGHQFNKVEIFQFVVPEEAGAALAEMVACVQNLVSGLGLHHRTSILSAMDASASMKKTLDVEVWIPSIADFKEVSSVSWAGDYQARRASIRYRLTGSREVRFVHTLNGSALATSRLMPAILEQFQQKDGSVIVPEALRPFLGGVERLS